MTQSIATLDSSDENPLSGPFLAAERAPLRVWCSRQALHVLTPLRLAGSASRCDFALVEPTADPPCGPAVLVLDAKDLNGPERAFLFDIAQSALPGRPIVIGGSDDRKVLLEAINHWRAFRLLPQSAPAGALLDAIREAHDLLSLDIAVERCAHELLVRCHRLAATIRELNATRERLLHAERLATVGHTIGALMARMQDQSQRLAIFRHVLAANPLSSKASASKAARTLELMESLVEAQSCFDALLTDMLALVEVRPTELRLESEPLDDLVARTVRLFQYDPLGQAREIEVDCGSGVIIRADRDRLRHALLNLLRNAAQATRPSDHIRVRVKKLTGMAIIEVEDTGEGMKPETLEHIFTAFFTTKGPSGMGLGLRLARATVESHGGTLDCTTVLGQGSTFRIRLPILD